MSIRALIQRDELKLAQKLVNKANIPSPPKLLMNIKSELTLSEPDVQKIICWVSEDIGLAAAVIKTINSPLCGLKVEINSLDQAVNLLGIKKLKDLIIGPAYRQAMEKSFDGFEDISETAHQVGTVAEIISCEIATSQTRGSFYLAGLFHHVGTLIMGTEYSGYMSLNNENALNPISWPALEQDKFGLRHMAVGVLLAKHWGLPSTVCNAIYLHHSTVATYNKLLDSESIALSCVLKLAINFVNRFFLHLTLENSIEHDILYKNIKDELMLSDETLAVLEQDAQSVY